MFESFGRQLIFIGKASGTDARFPDLPRLTRLQTEKHETAQAAHVR